MREWENQKTSNEKGIADNYKSIEWTRVRVAALHDLYEVAPLGTFVFYCFSIKIKISYPLILIINMIFFP